MAVLIWRFDVTAATRALRGRSDEGAKQSRAPSRSRHDIDQDRGRIRHAGRTSEFRANVTHIRSLARSAGTLEAIKHGSGPAAFPSAPIRRTVRNRNDLTEVRHVMKANAFRTAVAAAVVLLFVATSATAQVTLDKNRDVASPASQFGFGINDRGLHVQYALGPAVHIGLNLALDFYKDSARSETYYDFGPYAKFLLSGGVVNPYGWLGLGLVQPHTGSATYTRHPESGTGDVNVDLPDMEMRLYAAVGGEHFFNDNVGVYAHVNLLNALLAGGENDEVVVDGGLLGGTVGVEFFF
jgi:hypothetical protein